MCHPAFAAVAGIGMQLISAKRNYDAQKGATDYQVHLLNQGSQQYDQARQFANNQVNSQLQQLTPEATQQRTEQAANEATGSINQSILDANLAYGDDYLRTPGKTDGTYERAYAGRVADAASRSSNYAKALGQLQAPNFVALENADRMQRAGEQIQIQNNNAGQQSQIYQNAAGLVRPDQSMLDPLLAAGGGALTTYGLGNIFSKGFSGLRGLGGAGLGKVNPSAAINTSMGMGSPNTYSLGYA